MLLKILLVVLNFVFCSIRCDAVDISFRQSAKALRSVDGVVGEDDEVTTGILQVLRAKSNAFQTEETFVNIVKQIHHDFDEKLMKFYMSRQGESLSSRELTLNNLKDMLGRMLDRFVAERAAIRSAWNDYGDPLPDEGGELKIHTIEIVNNGPHFKGGRVMFLGVGGGKKIVYKPSSVSSNFVMCASNNEHSFFNILNEWVKEALLTKRALIGYQQLFQTYPVVTGVDSGHHFGFLYYLEHYGFGDIDEAAYISASIMMGELWAIQTLLRNDDMHLENMMVVSSKISTTCHSIETCHKLGGKDFSEAAQMYPTDRPSDKSNFVVHVPMDNEVLFSPKATFSPDDVMLCPHSGNNALGALCHAGVTLHQIQQDGSGKVAEQETSVDLNAVIRYRGFIGHPLNTMYVRIGFAQMAYLLATKKDDILTWLGTKVPANAVFRIVPMSTKSMTSLTHESLMRTKLTKPENEIADDAETAAVAQKQTARNRLPDWIASHCNLEHGIVDQDWRCLQMLALFGGKEEPFENLVTFMQDNDVPAAYYQWNSLNMHMPTTTLTWTTEHVKRMLRDVSQFRRFKSSGMTLACGICQLSPASPVPLRSRLLPLRPSIPSTSTCKSTPEEVKDIPNAFRHARDILDAQRNPEDILPKTLGELQLLYAENLLDDIVGTLGISGCRVESDWKCLPEWLQNSLNGVLRRVDELWCRISREIIKTEKFKATFPNVRVPPDKETLPNGLVPPIGDLVGSCLPTVLGLIAQ